MLELLPLQQTVEVLPTQSEWAWIANATDAEFKWGTVLVLGYYARDVAKDWIAAWQSVKKYEVDYAESD